MADDVALPKPEIRGVGHVQYRCALCGELMEPDVAVIRDGRAYHEEHLTEKPDGR